MVKKGPFWKKNSKKNPIPSHTEKSFTISILKKKKIPNYYYILALFVILPNSTLSVFNKKTTISNKQQQQKNQQTYKKQQKNTFYLIHSLFFWTLYNNSVFTISYFTSVLHYSLLFSWKKIMFWPKRNKKTNIIITNKGTAFPKKKIIEFEKNKKKCGFDFVSLSVTSIWSS